MIELMEQSFYGTLSMFGSKSVYNYVLFDRVPSVDLSMVYHNLKRSGWLAWMSSSSVLSRMSSSV